jgi:hypothetical protein
MSVVSTRVAGQFVTSGEFAQVTEFTSQAIGR